MARCGSCGGARRPEVRRSASAQSREYVDPTQAVFAAASPKFRVVKTAGSQVGKQFSTQAAAEDYARRTGGIIQVL